MRQPFLCCLFIICISSKAFSQAFSGLPPQIQNSQWKTDPSGHPLYTKNYTEAEGSPDFSDEYLPARVFSGGKAYMVQKVKLNLQDNVVFFSEKDQELVVTMPVDKIEFADVSGKVTFRNGFPVVDQQQANQYYQVLDSGKATLLKFIKVTVEDKRDYNSAVTVRKFKKENQYYAFLSGKMTKLGKNTDAIPEIFQDKKEAVKTYITQNKLKLKKEVDFVDIVRYYNGL